MVEFAFVLPLALIILLVTIQFAIIGNAALAITQVSYAGARYASISPANDPVSYVTSHASPIINTANLHVWCDASCTVPAPCGARTFGSPVTVGLSYDLTSNMFLPNPFLGISFPATLSCIQTTMLAEAGS